MESKWKPIDEEAKNIKFDILLYCPEYPNFRTGMWCISTLSPEGGHWLDPMSYVIDNPTHYFNQNDLEFP